MNMAIARCVIPVHALYKTGKVRTKLSKDGGRLYAFWGSAMLSKEVKNIFAPFDCCMEITELGNSVQPRQSRLPTKLINDPHNETNNWRNWQAESLTVKWSSVNITTNPNARINLELWGYWEDLEQHTLKRVCLASAHYSTRSPSGDTAGWRLVCRLLVSKKAFPTLASTHSIRGPSTKAYVCTKPGASSEAASSR